jgi:hypothetical protein
MSDQPDYAALEAQLRSRTRPGKWSDTVIHDPLDLAAADAIASLRGERDGWQDKLIAELDREIGSWEMEGADGQQTTVAEFIASFRPAPCTCTCHPDDDPPVPCARKYALSECRAAAALAAHASPVGVSTVTEELVEAALKVWSASAWASIQAHADGNTPKDGPSEAMRAALQAALSLKGAPEGWQPIETAPKDGTSIILFADAWDMSWGSVQVGRFDDGQWVTAEGAVEENEAGFDPDEEVDPDTWEDDSNVGPTHWRPLPAPPTEGKLP